MFVRNLAFHKLHIPNHYSTVDDFNCVYEYHKLEQEFIIAVMFFCSDKDERKELKERFNENQSSACHPV